MITRIPVLFFVFCALFSSLGYSQSLSNGLVGHFPLTTNGQDLVLNQTFTATAISQTTGRTPSSTAVTFNGSSSFIQASTDARSVSSQISISTWIKTTSTDTKDILVSKHGWEQNKGYSLVLKLGKVSIEGKIGTATTLSSGNSTTSVNDGNWHHVVGIASSTSLQIWVDGLLERTYLFTASSVDYNSPLAELQIARGNNQQCGNDLFYYGGSMSELRLYNRALTECEIGILYGLLPVNLTSNLVAHFPLNNNANDISSTSINGTPTSTETASNRFNISGNAIQFTPNTTDNTLSSKILAGGNNRSITNTVSLTAWIKTTSTNLQSVVSKYKSPQQSSDNGYQLMLSSAGKAFVACRNGNKTPNSDPSNGYFSALSTTAINDGQWHFIAGVIQSGGKIQIWVDGKLEAENNLSNVPNGNSGLQNDVDLCIGHLDPSQGGVSAYFDGIIDEVRVYSRALTCLEIGTLYYYIP